MKKTVAIFLSILFILSAVPASAEGIYAGKIPYSLMEETGIWYAIPVAEPMRALGYEVSFSEGVVKCSKGNISYIFDVPGYLFYYIEDGVRHEGMLSYAPVIYEGKTYVEEYFFINYVCKKEGLEFDTEFIYDEVTGEDGISFSIYDLSAEKIKLNEAYEKALEESKKYGIDPMAESEMTMEMVFDTNVSCDALGINITGGGNLLTEVYANLKKGISSVNMSGNVSGIFNIIKLVSGQPLDESKPFSSSVYMDRSGTYQKDSFDEIYVSLYGEEARGKWIYTPAVGNVLMSSGGLDLSAAVDMICQSLYLSAEEKADFLNAFTDVMEYSQDCVKYEKSGDKLTVSCNYTNDDIKEMAKPFFEAFSEMSEDEIAGFNSFFENSDISVSETEIYRNGKPVSAKGDVKIKFTFVIPDVNVPIDISVNMTINGKSGSSAIKQAPSGDDVYYYDGLYF